MFRIHLDIFLFISYYRCPHIREICRNRTAHPRMDVLYLTNAEGVLLPGHLLPTPFTFPPHQSSPSTVAASARYSHTHRLQSIADRTGSGQTLILPHTWLGTRTRVGQDVAAPHLLPRSPRSRQLIGGQSTLSTRFPYPQSTRQSSAHFHLPPG